MILQRNPITSDERSIGIGAEPYLHTVIDDDKVGADFGKCGHDLLNVLHGHE